MKFNYVSGFFWNTPDFDFVKSILKFLQIWIETFYKKVHEQCIKQTSPSAGSMVEIFVRLNGYLLYQPDIFRCYSISSQSSQLSLFVCFTKWLFESRQPETAWSKLDGQPWEGYPGWHLRIQGFATCKMFYLVSIVESLEIPCWKEFTALKALIRF